MATRDLDRELSEAGEWPPAWKPQRVGDQVIGVIRRYSTGTTMYGPCRTCILEQDNGERLSIWLSSTVLLSCFERERPKVGERVGIRFLGRHETKGYKKFALVVDRAAAELDFSPLGGERDAFTEPDIELPQRTTDRSPQPYAAATVSRATEEDPFS